MHLLRLIVTGALVGAVTHAPAEEFNETKVLESAKIAFFHVDVSGTPLDPTHPLQNPQRWGKAFAIGSNLLVTSRHVLGDETEWQLKRTTDDELNRAMRPLDRTIEVLSQVDEGRPIKNAVPLPSPANSLDAAGLQVPDLSLNAHFELSLCDIRDGDPYFALLTTGEPTEHEGLNSLKLVEITASGYDTEKFGPLYIFGVGENPGFQPEPWGHDGSPIFDRDGSVVAVVSAVHNSSSGLKILATPIQPLFPGTSRMLSKEPDTSKRGGARLRCSMVDMVTRIHNQVSSHAIWSTQAVREEGEPTGEIILSYESVADPPNIKAIRVDYQFWGEETLGDAESRIPFRQGGSDFVILEHRGAPKREFDTTEISRVGRTLVEPYLKTLNDGNGDGVINFVRLVITPTLVDGTVLEKRRVVREIQWSALN